MTLSSPELPAPAVQAWEPTEIAAVPAAPPTAAAPAGTPVVSVASAAAVFEVSPTAGIPDAVLNPARLAAQSAGYVAGWNRGREAGQLAVEAETALIRAAEEDQARATRARIALAVSALHAATESLDRRSGTTGAEVEELILASAFRLAEAIVGASLADDRIRGRAALARAMAAAPHDAPVVVRLNPDDIAVLETAGLVSEESVTLIADATLAPGDALATSGSARIDARIEAGLERARRVLLHDDPGASA
jgi:flagellar assembly protein FliH